MYVLNNLLEDPDTVPLIILYIPAPPGVLSLLKIRRKKSVVIFFPPDYAVLKLCTWKEAREQLS